MAAQDDTNWEADLVGTQSDAEKEKEGRTKRPEWDRANRAWVIVLFVVRFNPSGHAAARISTMMLWLNSGPPPNMHRKTQRERSALTMSARTMRRACWETDIQTLTFVLAHLCDAPGSRNASKHCDWREMHSRARCVCDRPGLDRWRRGDGGGAGEGVQRNRARCITYPRQGTETLQNPAFRGDSAAHYKLYWTGEVWTEATRCISSRQQPRIIFISGECRSYSIDFLPL